MSLHIKSWRRLALAALFGAATLAAGAANAATYLMDFTDQSGNVDAHLTLTTSGSYANGAVGVVSATGTIDGLVASLLGGPAPGQAYSPSGFFIYDNLLYPTSSNPNLDITNGGLLFKAGGLEWNVYSNGGAPGTDLLYAQGGAAILAGNVSVIAVPEPATWGLMVIGAGMMGAGLRLARRRQALLA